MARPKKIVDPKLVEELAGIGCKVNEIARICNVSDDTISRRFAAEVSKGKENLKMSLRRWQLRAAEGGNVTMLIWLGKQYLDQTEKVEQQTEVKAEITEVTYSAKWGNQSETDVEP